MKNPISNCAEEEEKEEKEETVLGSQEFELKVFSNPTNSNINFGKQLEWSLSDISGKTIKSGWGQIVDLSL